MCCEELFSKRPVHSLYAYVRKNLPMYTPPPHFSHKNTCNCLFMRRSSKKVATRSMHIFFLIFLRLCGSYYVHSNIVNIKGSIQACFLNFYVSNTSLPSLFYQTYSWIHLVFDFQLITLHHGYQKTRVCVFCFLSCLLSFHLSFVWNYSYYTSTELLARYKCMPISLFTPNFLPNVFRKQYVLLVYRSLLTCPPYLRAKQAAVQPCILPVNYFLTHKQCSCETFNYLCWWHLSWPTPPRLLPSPPCLSGNCLHFLAIICMCVVLSWCEKKR